VSGVQRCQKQELPLSTMEVYMKREEKILYHQIHPLEFLTDLAVGFIALPCSGGPVSARRSS
jgi:hypothetical protein